MAFLGEGQLIIMERQSTSSAFKFKAARGVFDFPENRTIVEHT